MTARFSWNQQNTRGDRPRLQAIPTFCNGLKLVGEWLTPPFPAEEGEIRRRQRSVLRRPFDVVDHQNFDRAFG
jgi:hypothetical protein